MGVPFGCYKIGRVAAAVEPGFLTNDIMNDPRVHDHKWAGKLGLASFAGYKLQSRDGSPIGVFALFSKQALTPNCENLLRTLASTASEVIQVSKSLDAVRENEVFLNSLLEAIPIPVFYKDKDGRYLGFNNAFETFLGQTRDQMIGKTVFDIYRPDIAETYHTKDDRGKTCKGVNGNPTRYSGDHVHRLQQYDIRE